MKTYIYKYVAAGLSALAVCATLTSCSDFFHPEAEDELSGDLYISSDTEMYTGFLGIMTKLQAAGDKEILLTDTRAELLEPTEESTPELISLYNYDADLKGNSYADPAAYYEIVIACNDYISKMREYRHKAGVDADIWKDLVSSTIRVKVWAYKTLVEIYGKAVWFDQPLLKVTDITEANGFQTLGVEQVVDKCLDLLNNGADDVPATRVISWYAWLDPDANVELSSSEYRKWNTMVPPYDGLRAELYLWKGACLDAAGADATDCYQKAADQMLTAINYYCDSKYMASPKDPGSTVYFLPSAATPGKYKSQWDYAQPYPQECAGAIIYDYTNNQTNRLLYHFSNEYPNQYLLRPSEYGQQRYTDPQLNPGGSDGDTRYKCVFGTSKGQRYISKFRPVGSSVRANAYQDDVHIYYYRGMQYHFMLVEALNHLKRYTAMDAVFNSGVTKEKMTLEALATDPEWAGFSRNWTADAEWGTRKYPSAGIRHAFPNLLDRKMGDITMEHSKGVVATQRFNDINILDEAMLEFACEGKTYAMMNRMALRYSDPSIVADCVCPKYQATGREGEIRGKIEAGGYWVPWEL